MNLWDWLNDNQGAMQVVFVAVLAVVTGVYAVSTYVISRATRQQTETSVQMVREMQLSRENEARPVVDIQQIKHASFDIDPQVAHQAVSKLYSYELVPCSIRNVGKGPALNIMVKDDRGGEKVLGTLGAGDEAEWELFLIVKSATNSFVEVEYQDVYGRLFSSRRRVGFDERGGRLRSLEVREGRS